jgi:hypothetical protein
VVVRAEPVDVVGVAAEDQNLAARGGGLGAAEGVLAVVDAALVQQLLVRLGVGVVDG